mgnify:CR=1 FL=1
MNPTTELPKTYAPAEFEDRIYQMWCDRGYFTPDPANPAPAFSVVIPPPNVTGQLHMGHALDETLQDILVRTKRMQGYNTLWVPGTDHAGIATQIKVEERLRVDEGKTRYDLGREEFLRRVWAWKDSYEARITGQLKKLGASCDWTRQRFTMDDGCSRAVREVFVNLYDKGLIYRGHRIINWCPHCATALSDAEVEYTEQPGFFWHIKYPIKGEDGYVEVATTRPETMFGDTAVAVNPNDETTRHLIGKTLILPIVGREIPVIADDYVEIGFGTGCVKITPAHDPNDFLVGERHGLEQIKVMNDDATMNRYAGKYEGMLVEESNPVILNDMKEAGTLFASEEIVHSYPHCWRCKHPIIFRATPQWFCSVDSFKEEACAACDDVRWVPGWGIERMKSMIRERADWCISRQRRWGLPIPVFYCKDCGKPICTDETIKAVSDLFREKGSNAWFDMEAEEILPKGFTCPHCGKNAGFTKEEDTLDGWFDSGSTHYASMKKDQGFWPATMYLEGLDQYRGWFQSSLLTAVGALGQGAPFKECVTHGWTVDGEGKAMHKSLGNGVDPADIFNENGADILRLWAASADYHADVRCSKEIFKQLSQNYLKFRNTCKFMLDNLVDFDPENLVKPEEMPKLDRWLITKLNELIEKAEQSYCDYEFHIITHAVNDFCVNTLSSFYLDIVKDRLYCDGADSLSRRSAQTALYLTLHTLSKLFAPILVFTCDEIWLAMPHTAADDARNVVLNEMNKPFAAYALTESEMADWEKLVDVRTAVNGVLEAARAEKKIGKSLEADVHLTVPAEDAFLANMDGKELADLLIVSQVEVTVGEGVKASAEEAAGTKCPRCWKHSTAANAEGLCPRCAEVMAKFPDLA